MGDSRQCVRTYTNRPGLVITYTYRAAVPVYINIKYEIYTCILYMQQWTDVQTPCTERVISFLYSMAVGSDGGGWLPVTGYMFPARLRKLWSARSRRRAQAAHGCQPPRLCSRRRYGAGTNIARPLIRVLCEYVCMLHMRPLTSYRRCVRARPCHAGSLRCVFSTPATTAEQPCLLIYRIIAVVLPIVVIVRRTMSQLDTVVHRLIQIR